MSAALLLKLLNLLALAPQVIEAAGATKDAFDQLKGKAQQFVDEGRNPTDAEWQEMSDDLDSINDQLQAI